MEVDNNNIEKIRVTVIDLEKLVKKLFQKKMMIIIACIATAVISSILIVCVPRGYNSQVMLAPEDDGSSGSTLSDIASSFGFDFGAMRSSDAIYPLLYPDLFDSNDFVVGLLETRVETLDGSIDATYLEYLMNHQKFAPWSVVINKMKGLVLPKPRKMDVARGKKEGIDPFMLTYKEFQVVKKVKENIKCTVDKKTNVITINVKDQDPLICATMADSACARLQNFITQYRTSKARKDYEYYSELIEEAKLDYRRSAKEYSDYCDSHKGMVLQADISKRDELESEMNANYNTLTVLNAQIQTAKARIQEKTPAFTMLQNASVPVKASTPKRMIFVFCMTLLAFVISTLVAVKKILAEE
ncbi:MAG: chain-length determining protein [Bacteroidaceae bacterium]|nr:chain-length determining protein [Bacteroidaceae bacterium]